VAFVALTLELLRTASDVVVLAVDLVRSIKTVCFSITFPAVWNADVGEQRRGVDRMN